MIDIRVLMRLFDIYFSGKLLFLLLLYSLIPLGEVALFLYLGDLLGLYLILSISAVISLIGFLTAYRKLKNIIIKIKKEISEGYYPQNNFEKMAGLFLAALFIITPGFVTDLFGFLFLFPLPQSLIGRSLIKKRDLPLKELYEYLKL